MSIDLEVTSMTKKIRSGIRYLYQKGFITYDNALYHDNKAACLYQLDYHNQLDRDSQDNCLNQDSYHNQDNYFNQGNYFNLVDVACRCSLSLVDVD